MKTENLSELSQHIYSKADSLYEFVLKYNDMMHDLHDYGDGQMLNMIEMHLVSYIDQNPGITVSKLAKMWNRTKGAISQQVKKLEANGYINKVKHDSNGRVILLYTSESGKKLSSKHINYDVLEIMKTTQLLLQNCTSEEVDAFFKVVGEYIKILNA